MNKHVHVICEFTRTLIAIHDINVDYNMVYLISYYLSGFFSFCLYFY